MLFVFFVKVNTAHLVLKDNQFCSGKDPVVRQIYDILCSHVFYTTDEINHIVQKQHPSYSLKFMPDTAYQALYYYNYESFYSFQKNSLMYSEEKYGQIFNNLLNSGKVLFQDLEATCSKNGVLGRIPKKVYLKSLLCDLAIQNNYLDLRSEEEHAVFDQDLNREFEEEFRDIQEIVFQMKSIEPEKIFNQFEKKISESTSPQDRAEYKNSFMKLCSLEESASEKGKIVLVRGSDGFQGEDGVFKVDSVKRENNKMGNLSFGKGAFQAQWGRDLGASPWYYRDGKFFYALEVDKNNINKKDSVMFIPPLLPVTLLFFSGEFHSRTRFSVPKEVSFFSKIKEHNIDSENEEIVSGFFNTFLPVKPHGHFCCFESEQKTCDEIDVFVMKNAIPLKNEEEFNKCREACLNLKNLQEKDNCL
ncbi:MAG: hypothetical protein BGO07_03290 [Alphaproteobacteria bacterium 40-19]|nr:MAG: hypothetical protein BGO07_03290 [Alphaproteobacteria bacterium 40-19]